MCTTLLHTMKDHVLFYCYFFLLLFVTEATLTHQTTSFKNQRLTCDMKNRIITAITLEEEPHVVYNRSCIAKLPESGSTHFEVTNCISGWLVDLFHVLEDHCNFKLKAFASHKNIPYGDVVQMEDGGHHLSGLFAEGINFDIS